MKLLNKNTKGFTLIELLVVIGILGILLAIVLIAINPAAQFAQANNTARTNDVNTILNAVHQYGADHKGNLAALDALGLPTAPAVAVEIMGGVANPGGADVCGPLSPDYVSLFPVDPDGLNNGAAVADCTADYATGYFIVKDTSGRITVSAPGAESVRGVTPVIQVTR